MTAPGDAHRPRAPSPLAPMHAMASVWSADTERGRDHEEERDADHQQGRREVRVGRRFVSAHAGGSGILDEMGPARRLATFVHST